MFLDPQTRMQLQPYLRANAHSSGNRLIWLPTELAVKLFGCDFVSQLPKLSLEQHPRHSDFYCLESYHGGLGFY